jgi:hypothetical protein
VGNTVGSSNNPIFLSLLHGYVLGLWGADGYQRTSSIGITTIYPEIVKRMYDFFKQSFDSSRIKLRVYSNDKRQIALPQSLSFWYAGTIHYAKGTKLRALAYQLYVNSRPLLRQFNTALSSRLHLPLNEVLPYFSGRFDGDGSVASDLRTDWRIAYRYLDEALTDQQLLTKIGYVRNRVYRYSKSGTYVLYVSRYESNILCRQMMPYSAKLSGLLVTP